MKSQNPEVKVVAVEPSASPVLSQGKSGAHKIQGIGAGFVPETLNTKVYDEVFPVNNEDAFRLGKEIACKGRNSGWNFIRRRIVCSDRTGEETGK